MANQTNDHWKKLADWLTGKPAEVPSPKAAAPEEASGESCEKESCDGKGCDNSSCDGLGCDATNKADCCGGVCDEQVAIPQSVLADPASTTASDSSAAYAETFETPVMNHWDLLANQLGLGGAVSVNKMVSSWVGESFSGRSAETVKTNSLFNEPPVDEEENRQKKVLEQLFHAPAESTSVRDVEPTAKRELVDDILPVEAESEIEAEAEGEEIPVMEVESLDGGPSGDDRPRRRRRRRRGRGGRGRTPEGAAEIADREEVVEAIDYDPAPFEPEILDVEHEEIDAEADVDSDGEPATEKREGRGRSRRRGRRGGRRNGGERQPDRAKETSSSEVGAERSDRGERTERPERVERSERSERTDRGDRPERAPRGERADRGERTDRGVRSERSDRSDRTERGERSERGERVDRADRGSDRSERPERGERRSREEYVEPRNDRRRSPYGRDEAKTESAPREEYRRGERSELYARGPNAPIDDDEDDDDDSESELQGRGKKVITWVEAINTLVDTNIEQRHSNRGGGREGGRGHGSGEHRGHGQGGHGQGGHGGGRGGGRRRRP